MVDYSQGKVYRLVCNLTGLVYVGSTAQSLSQRLGGHRADYKKNLAGKKPFITCFKVMEGGNYSIILLERFPCESREELEARERDFMEQMDCVNRVLPTRTHKQWYEQNRDAVVARQKDYYEQNKEAALAYANERVVCDCGSEQARGHLARHLKTKKHLDWQKTSASSSI